MKQTLRDKSILVRNLFHVDGGLVDNYNRALERVVGKKTSLKSFTIDKRGESPEIEKELGLNYLQAGSAHRYMIIVSPNQRNSKLIHEEFSFDNDVIDFIYENYLSSVSVTTRVDSMYSELDDGVRCYDSLDDLLLIRKIIINLQTPSEFLPKAQNLQKLIAQLEQNSNLLIENNSEVPRIIHKIVKEVGDVRGYNLSNIRLYHPVDAFYTRLLDGAHVFRSFGDQKCALDLTIPGKLPVKEETEDISVPKTFNIYGTIGVTPMKSPSVEYISLNETKKVIDFLVENKYTKFNYELIDPRLTELEDKALLDNKYDITKISPEQRTNYFEKLKEKKIIPGEWYLLRDIKKKIGVGYEFNKIIKESDVSVQCMLLQPQQEGQMGHIVSNLLTKLWMGDYIALYEHNQRDLEHVFDSANKITKNYIIKKIQDHKQTRGL